MPNCYLIGGIADTEGEKVSAIEYACGYYADIKTKSILLSDTGGALAPLSIRYF